MLLKHLCDIKRNVAVGSNGRKQLQTLYTSVSCLVLPMSAPSAVQNGFDVGRAYDIFFEAGQDVKTGDKVLSGGRSFIVSGTQVFEVPLVGHVRALCQQEIT